MYAIFLGAQCVIHTTCFLHLHSKSDTDYVKAVRKSLRKNTKEEEKIALKMMLPFAITVSSSATIHHCP